MEQGIDGIIHRHSLILRLDLFGVGFTLYGECRSNSVSTEVRFAATQQTGYQQPLARVPVVQLVRASDQHSEDLGSNPDWISMSFFTIE